MGIENFHKWLNDTHPKCIKPIEANFYDYVYIDINCILHRIVANSTNENMLLKKLCSYIDNLLKINIPVKRIIFAIDGAAPFAKILLQRKRRLQISRNIKQQDCLDSVNPLQFTPGTKFMKSFPEKMNTFITKLETTYKIKVELLFGPGEAEFKLLRKFLDITKTNNNINHNHIIISTDADIIVMIASVSNIKNVYINNLKYVISINEMIDLHCNKYGKSANPNYDFMLISMFMGNDYLPKVNYINFNKLWDSYKYALDKYPSGCIQDKSGKLCYDFLQLLLQKLITNIPIKWLGLLNINNFNDGLYKNYLNGLNWCQEVYLKGCCEQTDYMYKYDTSPHPLGLLYYISINYNELNKESFKLNKIQVPDDIYAILVLPKSYTYLLDKTYTSKIDNRLDFLYDNESCKKCENYQIDMNDLQKQLKENNCEIIKNKIKRLSTIIGKHKKTHKDIQDSEIKYAINCLI